MVEKNTKDNEITKSEESEKKVANPMAKRKYEKAIVDKRDMKIKCVLALLTLLAIFFAVTTFVLLLEVEDNRFVGRTEYDHVLEVRLQFYVPENFDLRGYDFDHFEVEEWFLERINYYREGYGVHPYEICIPAAITSIEHSLDMRDNEFGSLESSDGRSHQQRHDRWMGVNRTEVTSAHFSGHDVEDGPLTKEKVEEIVDRMFTNEENRLFLLNPTYYYIGIGFSIQENGLGRLSITMVSQPDEWDAHRARTPEEREIHRQEYLERVREERGWTEE